MTFSYGDDGGVVTTPSWLSRLILLAMLVLFAGLPARADVVLLVEEPINMFGRVTSSGHASLLVEGLCSDDHLHMRVCRPGEMGSVVSRYDGIGKYDWLAMQPMPYFFAADAGATIPTSITLRELEKMREDYRVAHLESLAPSGEDGPWIQLVGASYRRRIIGVRVHTTAEQDLRLMHWLNARRNTAQFHLLYSNCADFTRMMLNVLYPGAIHRNLFFDADITTPKQLVSALHAYAMRHPEPGWELMVLPQVAGDVPRSGRMYGVTEGLVRTKPWLLPLAILQPEAVGGVALSGLFDRRYNIHRAMISAPNLSAGDVAGGEEFALRGKSAPAEEKTRTGSGGN